MALDASTAILLAKAELLEKLNRLARDGRYKKEIIAAARAEMEK